MSRGLGQKDLRKKLFGLKGFCLLIIIFSILRLQRISLDEHYARLYGPNMLAHRKQVHTILKPMASIDDGLEEQKEKPAPSTAVVMPLTTGDLDADRHKLQQAFKNSPFER